MNCSIGKRAADMIRYGSATKLNSYMSIDPEFAKIIKELAWPLVCGCGLFMFKKQITGFIVEISSLVSRANNMELEYKGTKLSMAGVNKELQEVKSLVQNKETTTNSPPVDFDINQKLKALGLQTVPTNFKISAYEDLSKIDPAAALMAIRRDLEIAMQNVATLSGIQRRSLSFKNFLNQLQRDGAIDLDQKLLADKMYDICTAAVHGAVVNESQLKQVLDAATFLRAQLINWVQLHLGRNAPPPNLDSNP